MARNLDRLAEHANRTDFIERVRLSLTAAALKALDGSDDDAARVAFGRSVLRGEIPIRLVVAAVLASMAETLPAVAGGTTTKPMAVADTMIEDAMRPGGDMGAGIFGKLAIAHLNKNDGSEIL